MPSIEIKRVGDKKDLKSFIDLHFDLYKGNSYDAPNVFIDEMNTLSKDKNAAFEFCEAEYFLAYKNGQLVGRVAAIINHRYNEQWQRPTVRFGWLDLIDDIKVLKALLKAVENYGRKVLDVVNKTFSNLYGYSQMTQQQTDAYLHEYFKFFSMDMLCVIEDRITLNHDVIGVGITIPSLTKALQKCWRGRLLPFGWWHLIRALKFHKTDIVDMLLIGVLPEYRSKGANALLFYHLIPVYQKYGFKWGESHVHMESNTAVLSQWQYFDNEQHQRRRCYKKAL